jgi:acyl-CoA reductase-like NAD-dependent aldehyde dehydrogenase
MKRLQRHHMLIDRQWVGSTSGEEIESVDPAAEEAFARFSAAAPEDVDAAVKAARRALPEWSAIPVQQRGEILRKVADGIRAESRALAELETRDMGKPIYDSTTFDLPDAAAAFDFFAAAAVEVRGETIVVSSGIHDFTLRSPAGVVGQITAWNFPLVNAAWKIAPALAMGNTVVFKPSELASLTALELGRICGQAGMPRGALNIITGNGACAGAALARHNGINRISFTGSTNTGRSVFQAGAANLAPATLELGGKSPNIVFEDANLEQAVSGALAGIFINAGQVCTAGSRLLLQRSIYGKFLDRFLDRTRQIQIGPGMDPSVRLGPLVSSGQQERVRRHIKSGVKEGAHILFEGAPPAGKGCFVPPTIFDQVDPRMRIAREEIFGPVLCVFGFDTEEEAIAFANDTEYGLAAGIWTCDLARAHRVARQLDAGTVWINTYNFVTPQMPTPARKASGIGVELGRQGLEEYTLLKNVVVNIERETFDYFGPVL